MIHGETRYVFTGWLVLETPLHIGGGGSSFAPTEHPVLRTAAGLPTIPGSSLKGAFRSAVERLAGSIGGVRTCALVPPERNAVPKCVGPQSDEQRAFNEKRANERWSQSELLKKLEEQLCDTCWLFGSPYAASHIEFADLVPEGAGRPPATVRDGVAIDRDTGKVLGGRKFDYEVVETGLRFPIEITLTALRPLDLGLTCLGLGELLAGRMRLGGKVSRGLGRVRLDKEGFRIFSLDLSDSKTEAKGLRAERVQRFLLARCGALPPDTPLSAVGFDDPTPDPEAFLKAQVADLLRKASTRSAAKEG
jgi:CRISPR-associated RAMP protein (TIGR02581 family)